YQAILERRPAEIILRLKELLTSPDPNIGYLNGELRFWLGWAQEVAGDNEAARETWRQARAELEALVKDQPENWALLDDLALITASLGNKAAALALVQRAMALNPIEKEAANGMQTLEILARVATRVGEHDRAITVLEEILSRPGMAVSPQACRSLLRSSSSIRCSIRCGTIRASKCSPTPPVRNSL